MNFSNYHKNIIYKYFNGNQNKFYEAFPNFVQLTSNELPKRIWCDHNSRNVLYRLYLKFIYEKENTNFKIERHVYEDGEYIYYRPRVIIGDEKFDCSISNVFHCCDKLEEIIKDLPKEFCIGNELEKK